MDTLRPELSGSRCLDLFAGLGRFGLGALKESAFAVTFVDTSGPYLEEVKAAAKPYGDAARFVRDDAFRFLARTEDTFDIVFADPPFPLWKGKFEEKLFAAVLPRLAPSAIFLVKHPEGVIVSGPGFTRIKISPFGESALSYFTHGNDQ